MMALWRRRKKLSSSTPRLCPGVKVQGLSGTSITSSSSYTATFRSHSSIREMEKKISALALFCSSVGRTLEEFKTSVTVAAHKKVTFELTYEELLKRRLGKYELQIHARPMQAVKDFKVCPRRRNWARSILFGRGFSLFFLMENRPMCTLMRMLASIPCWLKEV